MFIPRHPVVENQFCSYGSTTDTNGAGGVIAYAGSVVYAVEDATNEEALVKAYGSQADFAALGAEEKVPFGFLLQKVKTGYHSVHPTGFYMPGDLGSSDVIAQPTYDTNGAINGTKEVPVGVGHLGIYDTVHYTCKQTTTLGTVDDGDHMKPGQKLYAAANAGGRVTNCATVADNTDNDGECLVATAVGRVLKGVSAAKATANVSNVTLYPMRFKLLI